MTPHTHNSVGYRRVEEGMAGLGYLPTYVPMYVPTYLIYHPNLPTERFTLFIRFFIGGW